MHEIADFRFELKAIDADAGTVEGLAAAFGNRDLAGDVIVPGAFATSLKALGKRPLPMLLHHAPDRPCGAWTEAAETAEGLAVKGRLALDTRDGAEARSLLEIGALRGLSIGFANAKRMMVNGQQRLVDMLLVEASLVTTPANPRAQVTAFKRAPGPLSPRDIERALAAADLGFSARERKTIAGLAARQLATDQPDPLAAMAAEFEAARLAIRTYGRTNSHE